jgi:hypothetical protein
MYVTGAEILIEMCSVYCPPSGHANFHISPICVEDICYHGE